MRPALLATFALVSILASRESAGEYQFFTPPGSFTVEVSLENAPFPRLPLDRNAIVSLEVCGDYAVGGTAAAPGLSPFLFTVSLTRRRLEGVLDLGAVVPGQREIRSGFARGRPGVLYAGTIPNSGGESGHLIEVRADDGKLQVVDLGVPVAGEGIFSLASDPAGGKLYGIAHPSGTFFAFDLSGHRTRVFPETALSRRSLAELREHALTAADVLSRRLILDRSGRVYGSAPVNRLFRFDPLAGSIVFLPDELPAVWGRRPLGRVDAWAQAPDGMLYGGCAGDGQIFRLDPAIGRVTNIGKPVMMPRIPGLSFAADGRLYGIAGAPPGYSHLFVYDPRAGGYTDLGNPRFTMTEPGIEQGIAWRGFRIATVAASEDGRYIVMGEDESLSQLMVFPVQ